MDEETDFAKLISSTALPSQPSWSSPAPAAEHDPWANPFSDAAPSSSSAIPPNPFAAPPDTPGAYDNYLNAGTGGGFGGPAEAPKVQTSPYVLKLEEDGRPDPPSVIAAREREAAFSSGSGFNSPGADNNDDPFSQPYQPPPPPPPQPAAEPTAPRGRKLPAGLIDEELMAENDAEQSLKKAFVKSSPAPRRTVDGGEKKKKEEEVKPYVFKPAPAPAAPAKEEKDRQSMAETPAERENVSEQATESTRAEQNGERADAPPPTVDGTSKEAASPAPRPTIQEPPPSHSPETIALPPSSAPTPAASRPLTPQPPAPLPSSPALQTPTDDRVAVSPLEAPASASSGDYGFKGLSIGASSMPSAPVSAGSGERRFAGKGWGVVDEDESDSGLFGKGGPAVRSDPWGGNDDVGGGEGGWGEPGILGTPSAGPSTQASTSSTATTTPTTERPSTPPSISTPNGTPSKIKLLNKPLFQISVGDPTRVGDPVRGYTVYTVRTRTTSPHYRKGDFSVLRRFSDFLWLYEALTLNNPGVIVPPVPDKHVWGRFKDQFIETRRQALQRCLTKMTSHPVLQLDPDLRLFLESDHFAAESKSRRAEAQAHQEQSKGLLSGWTGPKFVEQDEWFESRRSFLDSLENQLKALSKSIEAASKTRLDMAASMGDFADSVSLLAESDLGSAMCAALARLADLARRERETSEEQAKDDVVHLLNLADEYVRFIGSVRGAFAARVRAWMGGQNAEREVGRLKGVREKMRQQGKLSDRAQQGLAEIADAERKARDAATEFEHISRLVKSEFARFEKERVDEFKRVLEKHLEGQIAKQRELIDAWEEYHAVVLQMVEKSQAHKAQSQQQQKGR